MMRKGMRSVVTIVAMAFVLASASQSVAQTAASPALTLRVEAVNGTQAVLTDRNTGVQTTVQVGDLAQGWTIVAITPAAVEIEREDPDAGRKIRTQLHVGIGGLLAPSP